MSRLRIFVLLQKYVVCCIMQRTHHPGNIVKRRAFYSPFTHYLRRLTGKIDDHEILSREQDLPEVIIAVDADPR